MSTAGGLTWFGRERNEPSWPMGILGDSRAWLSTVAVLHALAKGGTKPGGPDDGVSLGIPDDGHSRIGIEPRDEAKVGLFG